MKKILVLVFTLVVIFSFSFVETKAVCNPPATVVIIDFPLCPGCNVLQAKLCINCTPISGDMSVHILEIYGCPDQDPTEFLSYIQAWIGPNYAELCVGAWKPCNEGTTELKVWTPLCFYEDDENEGNYLFCNDAYCVETSYVCIENGETIITGISWEVVGSTCPTTLWQDREGSNCFRMDDCPEE